jgi:hypothetical protein
MAWAFVANCGGPCPPFKVLGWQMQRSFEKRPAFD